MNKGDQRPRPVEERSATAPGARRLRGAAYSRHSARHRQGNPLAMQRELVQKWARKNGVLHDFADRGKSGLTAEGRDEGVRFPLSAWPVDETHTKAPGNA